MALPTLFANLTQATGQQLDNNFAAVGVLGIIPCSVTGTNAITLTPGGNTPTVSAYANYQQFSFIAGANNTTTVTAQIGALGLLSVYKNTTAGPTALSANNIIAGNVYVLVYDSALSGGAGGFHIVDATEAIAVGTVTSVAASFTGGLISIGGSPITSSGTLAFTVAGTSGGVPYFSSASTWGSSALLVQNALMIGGGAGSPPATTTTGTGVLTALGVNVGSAGAFVVNGGALGVPASGTLTSCTGLPVSTGISGFGTGVATLLAGNASGTGGPAGTTSTSLTTPLITSPTIAGAGSVTGGFGITSNNLGTITTVATTLTVTNGPQQYLTNNGNFTLAAPAADGNFALLITNGASAGTITWSGFTVGVPGDSFTTTNGNKFLVSVIRINGVSTYIVKALQ